MLYSTFSIYLYVSISILTILLLMLNYKDRIVKTEQQIEIKLRFRLKLLLLFISVHCFKLKFCSSVIHCTNSHVLFHFRWNSNASTIYVKSNKDRTVKYKYMLKLLLYEKNKCFFAFKVWFFVPWTNVFVVFCMRCSV